MLRALLAVALLLKEASCAAAGASEQHGSISAPPGPRGLASRPVAVPSAQQLQWQDLEVAAMLGWNLQTICVPKSGAGGAGAPTAQKCQASSKTEGALYVPTLAQVADWNPAAIDTDEWARVSASFGAKYVVIVADHMTGFTWWDTKYHNYSIAHTKYQLRGVLVCTSLCGSVWLCLCLWLCLCFPLPLSLSSFFSPSLLLSLSHSISLSLSLSLSLSRSLARPR